MFLRGYTVRTASPITLIVGTILSAVNQAHVIAAGEATAATWVRIAFNYVVPFVVSSLGYLSARCVHADEPTDHAPELRAHASQHAEGNRDR